MRAFFKSRKFKIFIAVIVLLLISSTVSAFVASRSAVVTSVGGTALNPVQRVVIFVSQKASGVFTGFKSKKKLEAEIENDKKLLSEYREKLVDYENMKKKVSLYEDMVGYKEENPKVKTIAAAISGRNAADRFGSFTINKGKLSGIKVNDPVVYGKNLVGVVKSVKPNYSVVLTVYDPAVKISVYDISAEESSLLENSIETGAEGLCQIPSLGRKSAMTIGDFICTTGIGNVFPRDLLIGEISELRDNEDTISRSAVIKPFVDISQITNVFVITKH